MSMTSRERVLTALAHELPDRVPLDLWARPEVDRALSEHFKVPVDQVHHTLGVDTTGVSAGESFPEFLAKTNGALTGDCPYSGSKFIFQPNGDFEDAFGVVRRKGTDGKYVEWVRGPLSDDQDLASYQFPKIVFTKSEDQLHQDVLKQRQIGAVSAGMPNPFKAAWELRGLENFLMDMVAEPEQAQALLKRVYDYYWPKAERVLKAGIDVFSLVGDIAMQNSLLMNPQTWREVDKPLMGALIAKVKRVRPDIKVYFHSDGNVEAIIDDLVEIGIDILNPIQPECMDPGRIKQRYGKKLTLWGGGSLQRTLPFGSEEDVRAEVRELMETCGRGGGFVLMISNVVGFDVPLKNVLAFFDEAKKFRAPGITR